MAERFVIVGRGGRLATSEDAISWTGRTSGTPNDLEAIAASPNRWLAATDSLELLRSATGIGWTVYTAPDYDPFALAWNGSFWVAATLNGTIFTSFDGVSWTEQDHGIDFPVFEDVTWDAQNGQWLVAGEDDDNVGLVLTSPDAVTWTRRSVPSGFRPNGIAANSGTIVISSRSTTGTSPHHKLASSTDAGLSWTTRSTVFTDDTDSPLFCVWAGAAFLAGGNSGLLTTSPDGVTWTTRASGFNSNGFIFGATYGAGLYVIAGRSSNIGNTSYGQIMSSPDLAVWTERTSSTFAAATFQSVSIQGIAYGPADEGFSADSVIRKTLPSSFAADAEIAERGVRVPFNAILRGSISRSFGADAALAFDIDDDTTGRNPHDRAEQHFGSMPATMVAHSATLTLEDQLRAVWNQMAAYESGFHKRAVLTANAIVYRAAASFFRADARLVVTTIGTFTADASLSGSFTIDAVITRFAFTVDAVIEAIGGEGGLLGDHTLGQHELGGE